MAALPPPYPIINEMYEAAAKYERGPARNYLGMSQIGSPCGRALWYGFRGFTPSAIEGRAKMIFSLGDRVEEEVIKWIELAGYRVTDRQRTLVGVNGFFRGHWDGLIEGISSSLHILEIKSANTKRFKAYEAQGIKDLSPQYYCQVQCYMGYSGYEKALFVVMNKDNCELYTERIKFSKADFAMIETRARNIIYSNEAPPKAADNCQYCGYHELCEAGSYVQTNSTCGTCKHFVIKGEKMYCTLRKGTIPAEHWGKCCGSWSYIYANS